MTGKEIKITKFKLEDNKGNLRQLISNFDSAPSISSDLIGASSGYTAESVKDCLESTKQVKKSLMNLLKNTLDFCESVGINFEEVDEKASQNIDNLTK